MAARTTRILLGMGVVVALGVLVSVQPFTGDQALFASGARQLAHGDVLYRDVWDVKQPGIYLFYLAGYLVVGHGETAQHLFELGVLLVFAAVLVVGLRDAFVRASVVALVPVFVVGTYYSTAEPLHLGQVESLIGFPLFVVLVGAVRGSATAGSRRWLFVAGLAGGAAVVTKLVVAPIVIACLLPVLSSWRASPSGVRRRRVIGDTLTLAAGFAIPLLAVIAYLTAYGQLSNARWTYFEVTPQTTAIAGRPWHRLADGALHTTARWAVPLAFAGLGAIATFRRGWTSLEIGLVAWTVAAVPVFLVQHWWIYQYAMFLVPVGIFAAHGVDALLDARSRSATRRAVVVGAALCVLAVPLALRIAANVRAVVRHDGALTVADRDALHAEAEPNYRDAAAWTAHLRRVGKTPDGVYVLGNPLDLFVSGRRQSVAINGWSPEQYPESVWARLRAQLVAERPDQIVVDRFSRHIMRDRSPETLLVLHRWYEPVGRSGDETWYRALR